VETFLDVWLEVGVSEGLYPLEKGLNTGSFFCGSRSNFLSSSTKTPLTESMMDCDIALFVNIYFAPGFFCLIVIPA
jgi:hypothetical protein